MSIQNETMMFLQFTYIPNQGMPELTSGFKTGIWQV